MSAREESGDELTHLLGLGHALDHDEPQVAEHLGVDASPVRARAACAARAAAEAGHAAEAQERVGAAEAVTAGVLDELVVQVGDELGPVLEADLEHLALLDLRDLDEVQVRVEEDVAVLGRLEDGDVRREEVGEEQGEVEDELLVGVGRRLVRAGDVGVGRDHLVDARHDHVEQDDELVVVLGPDLEAANLGQALERHVAELGHLEELRASVSRVSMLAHVQERLSQRKKADARA